MGYAPRTPEINRQLSEVTQGLFSSPEIWDGSWGPRRLWEKGLMGEGVLRARENPQGAPGPSPQSLQPAAGMLQPLTQQPHPSVSNIIITQVQLRRLGLVLSTAARSSQLALVIWQHWKTGLWRLHRIE